MRILITGGAGFIGSNLTRECESGGHEIVVLDDLSTGFEENLSGTNAELLVGSITDPNAVRNAMQRVDAVVHLAARGSVPRSLADPIATHDVNVTGSLNVLDAARNAGCAQVILASSSSVYGANAELPKRESAATRPMSPYAASKLAAEAYALSYGTSFQMATLAFRFFNVFGRFQSAGHAYAAVIPAFIDAALRGEPLTVHGDGTQSRDFTHVGTVCRTIRRAVEEQIASKDPVNLAFGTRTSLLSVIELISTHIDQPIVVKHTDNRQGDVPHSQADSTLLDRLLPGIQPLAFEAGLLDTIQWMRSLHSETEPTTKGALI